MKKTKDIMEGINTFLKTKYGSLQPEWTCILMALEDTIDRYLQIKKEIDKTGIYDGANKNPLISSEKDCLATILKLSQKLGVSPWDASKIKDNSDEDDTEDFVSSLIEEK